jgi:thioredoxin 1
MLLSQDQFETDVLGSTEPVLVDFFGTWCGPCRVLAPTIDRIAGAGYAVCKVNIDERADLAVQYGVRQVPTLVISQEGEEIARFVGVQSERTLRDTLDRARIAAR